MATTRATSRRNLIMDGPDFIDTDSGEQQRRGEHFRPPDACVPNTVWYLFPAGTGSKDANKSLGYCPKNKGIHKKSNLPAPVRLDISTESNLLMAYSWGIDNCKQMGHVFAAPLSMSSIL
jgi:hypothetical protein